MKPVHDTKRAPKDLCGTRLSHWDKPTGMFRGKRLDFHHQKTITNHTRKGNNRILIRTAGRTRRRSLTGLKGIEGGVVSPQQSPQTTSGARIQRAAW
jgi:hypothetical protein